MPHHVYEVSDKYPVAILVKDGAFNPSEIKAAYVNSFVNAGIPLGDIIVFSLDYGNKKKASVKLIKSHLEQLLPSLEDLGTEYIYCADADYFKKLVGVIKADPHHGYVLPHCFKDSKPMDVVLGVNHRSLLYNPNNEEKLQFSVDTFINAYHGKTDQFTDSFLKNVHYPKSFEDIKLALQSIAEEPFISVDLETASLDHDKAGIGTIGFATSTTDGFSFACDYRELSEPLDGKYGYMQQNIPIRNLLKQFFEYYKGEIRYHNSTFDAKVAIYNLWMDHANHTEGLLTGLTHMMGNFQDTRVIAYLSLNSTADIELSLKVLAHEYAGNYAQEDIKDITKIPLPDLLEYNLVDCCCTNWVYDKYYPIMVHDQQEDIYNNLMIPSQRTICQTELTGMPLNPARVQEVKSELTVIRDKNHNEIMSSPFVDQAIADIIKSKTEKDYEDRRSKAKNPDKIKELPDKFSDLVFNPNSDSQLQYLLYTTLGLPVIDLTKGKKPSVAADTVEKLVNHTDEPTIKAILNAINARAKVEKILTTFITAFEKAIEHGDDVVWLHGNFNLNGTVSGRLSSSKPNLQNLPSGSTYGKLIKSCFQAPAGWLIAGADFNSLEDMVSALTTKDPNKLKVYTDGYDGHCLRAYSYFKDELPDIENTVESINSIKKKYPELRQESKAPTFALTYAGTHFALMNQCGFSEEKAKRIEANYHELYKISDQWVSDKLDGASDNGYVSVAFGLRLRTPLMGKTIRGSSTIPYAAKAEGRTVGNALGQSYGQLNNRALNEFMKLVHASEHRLSVKPIAMIHDSIYLVIENHVDVVKWVNDNLIKCMQWDDLPELKHPTVKLGAEMDLHCGSWASPVTLPNNASVEEIQSICTVKYDKHLFEVA